MRNKKILSLLFHPVQGPADEAAAGIDALTVAATDRSASIELFNIRSLFLLNNSLITLSIVIFHSSTLPFCILVYRTSLMMH